MNEHDATEIAYKNGYDRAVLDVLEDIKKYCCINRFGEAVVYIDAIKEIEIKYLEGRNG